MMHKMEVLLKRMNFKNLYEYQINNYDNPNNVKIKFYFN